MEIPAERITMSDKDCALLLDLLCEYVTDYYPNDSIRNVTIPQVATDLYDTTPGTKHASYLVIFTHA